jgi:ribosomal protein L11 methyltransferase
MRWLEISVDAGARGTERLCSLLAGLGVSGLAVEDCGDLEDLIENGRRRWDHIDEDLIAKMRNRRLVRFYLPDDGEGSKELRRLRAALVEEGYSPETAYVRDEDWENNWKRYYKPFEVGGKLLIVPEWEDVPETLGRAVLRLNPGLTFGTGSHPSTRLCLEALEALAPGAENALDLGCGSGILALAALALGAKTAFACDIDDKAPAAALANAALNGLGGGRLSVRTGDVLSDTRLRDEIGSQKWKLIFANIAADAIISLCSDVSEWLDADGFFICSGIIGGREDEVAAALDRAGLSVAERRDSDNWHRFTARHYTK